MVLVYTGPLWLLDCFSDLIFHRLLFPDISSAYCSLWYTITVIHHLPDREELQDDRQGYLMVAEYMAQICFLKLFL